MTKLHKMMLVLAIILVASLIWALFLSPRVNAEDFTQCGFYIENGTCEEMMGRCTSKVTEMIEGMNFGLQDELEECEGNSKEGTKMVVVYLSMAIAIYLSIKEFIRRRKENNLK